MPDAFSQYPDPFAPSAGPFGGPHPMDAGQLQEWERTYAMFLHLTLLSTHFVPIPVVPALIMWLIKKDESAFIRDHGKEVVNFQLTLLIYALIAIPLVYACGVGILLAIIAWALGMVGMVLGAVAANKGRYFRYPACLRLIA